MHVKNKSIPKKRSFYYFLSKNFSLSTARLPNHKYLIVVNWNNRVKNGDILKNVDD